MTESVPSSRVIAEHPPVELLDRRDDHTRIYEIVREIETTHPDGSTTVDTVKSYIHEKGSGLCYKDATGNYVPSVAEWQETPDGFVIDRCPYKLAMGKTIGTGARYTVEGHDLLLRPAYLIISDGINQTDPRPLIPDTPGFILVNNPSVLRFPAAFGDGYDLEYVTEKGGYHQNLIIAAPPKVPDGFDPENASIHLYTELNLDQYLTASACEVTVEGERVDTSAADVLSPPSRGGSIAFTKDGRLLHAFAPSRVTDSSGPGALDRQTIAEKRLLKDPSTATAYLVESLPFSYFTNQAETYPITWDYVQKSGWVTTETWDPRFTYWITDNVTVGYGWLTILPGTTVKLNPNKKISLTYYGRVVAKGEPYNYITFTKAEDDDCGEPLPNPPQGGWEKVFDISSDSYADSVIEYCKFGHGNTAIYMAKTLLDGAEVRPIQHNIFDDTLCGLYIDGCSATAHNNLMTYCSYFGIYVYNAADVVFTNNTIDHTSVMAGIFDFGSSSFTATDNLFSNCTTGIYTNTQSADIHHNRFFNVSTPISGASGYNNLTLDSDPYDQSDVGSFFIDPTETDLINAGSCPASAAGLGDDVFTVFKPHPVSSGTHSGAETWSKIGTDVDDVDIAYHHNRLDSYVGGDITFSGENASLTIEPGVVVAASAEAFCIDENATLTCVGDPLTEGYNILTNSRSASMLIESPRFACQTNPSLYICRDAADEVQVRFTRITWFAYALKTFGAAPGCATDNVFAFNRFAFGSDGCTNTLINNLFHRNWYGVCASGCDCECYNNTFDTNRIGLWYERASGRTLTAENNLFTDFTPSGLLPGSEPQGISMDGPQQGSFVHDYNAFYGLTHNIYDQQTSEEIQIGANSLDLEASPYHENKTGFDASWLLKQTPDPGEVLPVDAGSRPASEAGMDEFTTCVQADRDEGTVDIGFHHPLEYEYVDLRTSDLFGDVAAARERYDGAYVHYNIDDDNGEEDPYVADYTEQHVDNEDDVKLLQIVVDDSLTTGTVVLKRDNEWLQVWKHHQKGAGNEVLTGSPHQPNTEGNGKKTWDLSDPAQRDAVKEPLYVEGTGLGTAVLTVTYASGGPQAEDVITYTFIAATCGWQPNPDRRATLEQSLPTLVGCEWSATGPATPLPEDQYDCVAWSVNRTDECFCSVVKLDDDQELYPWGNANYILDISDIDEFYAWHGYVPTSNINDADVIVYKSPLCVRPLDPIGLSHAARRVGLPGTPSQCGCGGVKWVMFESKLGPYYERIEHRRDQLTGEESYGYPFRYYIEQ